MLNTIVSFCHISALQHVGRCKVLARRKEEALTPTTNTEWKKRIIKQRENKIVDTTPLHHSREL